MNVCSNRGLECDEAACPPYRVTQVLGKGRGLVATRRINVGEVLLEEMPMMVIESRHSKISLKEFREHYDRLDTETKAKILELNDSTHDYIENQTKKEAGNSDDEDETLRALRIFSNNSIEVCEREEMYPRKEGALYTHISLINHSCNPNCTWSWVKADFRRKKVIAVKPIGKNEEILVNYLDKEDFNFSLRQERREELLDKFHFICKCVECCLDNEALATNERIRLQIQSKIGTVQSLMGRYDKASTATALTISQEIVQLTEVLGMVIETPRCGQIFLES